MMTRTQWVRKVADSQRNTCILEELKWGFYTDLLPAQ
jgi:hypothetical protein